MLRKRTVRVWTTFSGGIAFIVAAAVLGSAALQAQGTAASDGETKPQMMAKDADPDWEVATVRPSDPDRSVNTFDVRGRHVIIGNRTVETMLLMAYGVQPSQIAGAPDWVKTEHFDAQGIANLDGQPNLKQFRSLVGKLLAERFGLVMHREQREQSVYTLRVAKSGPKMEKSKGDPDGLPNDEDHRNGGVRSVRMGNAAMGDLVLELLFYMDRPVVDQTGLKGRYDFTLKWTFDESQAPTDGSAPPAIFTAIQEQLGLKLEPIKAPADVLVVDKVERPSAN